MQSILSNSLRPFLKLKNKNDWKCHSMIEHFLGSIPSAATKPKPKPKQALLLVSLLLNIMLLPQCKFMCFFIYFFMSLSCSTHFYLSFHHPGSLLNFVSRASSSMEAVQCNDQEEHSKSTCLHVSFARL